MIRPGEYMPETMDGKRHHVRKIAAWSAWVRFHRSARYIKGQTRNVSRAGAYVVLPVDDSCQAGDAVDFILAVPSGNDDHFVIQAVNGEGHIVRVDKDDRRGVAVRFESEQDIP